MRVNATKPIVILLMASSVLGWVIQQYWTPRETNLECHAVGSDLSGSTWTAILECEGKRTFTDERWTLAYLAQYPQAPLLCTLYHRGQALCHTPEP